MVKRHRNEGSPDRPKPSASATQLFAIRKARHWDDFCFRDVDRSAAVKAWRTSMHIRFGYELMYECLQPVTMLLILNIHPSRAADLIVPDRMVTDPEVPIRSYVDTFGNRCSRIHAPSGQIQLSAMGLVSDTGAPDVVATDA